MSDLDVKLTLKATDQGLSGVVREVQRDTNALKDSFDEADKSGKSLGETQGTLSKELDNTAGNAKKAAKSNEQYTDSLKKTDANTKKVSQEQNKLGKQLKNTANKTKKADKEGKSFNKTLANGAVKAGKWLGALTAAATTAAAYAVIVRTESIRETQVLAQTLDISTQSLSEWEYAAGRVNVSGEKIGDIFKDVSDKLGDFITTGGGEAADLFENLNLKVNDLINLSPDEQLLAIGSALDDVGNRGQKIFFLESLANDASRLLPLLENDAALLKELQLEAQVLGVSLSDIDAEKVALAGQSFDRIKGLAKGITNDLTIELAPILGFISDSLVDLAIDTGGFRGAIKQAVDSGVSGFGFVLDVMQQLRVWLKYSEKGWLLVGQSATGAMASVATSTAKVINTVMYPFQQSLGWIIEKYSNLLELGAELGGPFAEQFTKAAQKAKGFSSEIVKYLVTANDIVSLNRSVTESLFETNNELKALIDGDAPSEVLKAKVAELRAEWEKLAGTQDKLGYRNKKFTGTVNSQTKAAKKQKEAYAGLVKTLEQELDLLSIDSERARKIEINQRKLGAQATKEQREEIARLTGQIYDFEQASQRAKDAAKPWQDAWENATERIDSVFADIWQGAFDGFDSFTDSLISGFKKTLGEMAHLAITKPIILNITSAIGGYFGIPGANQNNAAAVASGTSGIGSLLSLGSNVFNGGGAAISAGFDRFATSGFGQAIGLSNGLPSGVLGPVGLSNTGSFISQGLKFSPYGAIGGLLGGALGLGSGNPLVDGITGTVGSVAGGALGSSLAALGSFGGPLGSIAGSLLGTALGGLFGGSNKPTEFSFQSNSDEKRFEGRNAATLNNEFGELMFKVYRGRSQDKEITASFKPVLENIAALESAIASTLTATQIDTIKTNISSAEARGQDSTGTVDEFASERLDVILDQLNPAINSLAAASEKTGTAALQYTASIVGINEQLEDGGPIIDLFKGSLETAVGYLGSISNEEETIAEAYQRFQQSQSIYYQNFYSEEEKKSKIVDKAKVKLNDFNKSLSLTGEAAIDTKKEFRQYIESLDLTTESGKKAVTTALALQDALLTVANSSTLATDATNNLAKAQAENEDKLRAAERRAVLAGRASADRAKSRSEKIASEFASDIAKLINASQTRVDSLKNELNALNSLNAAQNLLTSNVSPLLQEQKVEVLAADLVREQLQFESGDKDVQSFNQLSSVTNKYLEALKEFRGVDPKYVADFLDSQKFLSTAENEIRSTTLGAINNAGADLGKSIAGFAESIRQNDPDRATAISSSSAGPLFRQFDWKHYGGGSIGAEKMDRFTTGYGNGALNIPTYVKRDDTAINRSLKLLADEIKQLRKENQMLATQAERQRDEQIRLNKKINHNTRHVVAV